MEKLLYILAHFLSSVLLRIYQVRRKHNPVILLSMRQVSSWLSYTISLFQRTSFDFFFMTVLSILLAILYGKNHSYLGY